MEYYDLYHEILFRYTDVLNDKVPKQKTITLSSLLRLSPSQIKYDELANEIYKE